MEFTVPEYCFIRHLDGEYKEKEIRAELCEAIDKQKPDFDDVVFKNIEAAKVVTVMHKGPYSRFGEAYAFAMKWIEENGYMVVYAPRESYIDGIWDKGIEQFVGKGLVIDCSDLHAGQRITMGYINKVYENADGAPIRAIAIL